MTANPRAQPLGVALIDGRLVISIGIDALMVAAQAADCWDEEAGYRVMDADGFADEIRAALEDEEDDGTTLVHVAIDTAVERALYAGSLSIDYGDGSWEA